MQRPFSCFSLVLLAAACSPGTISNPEPRDSGGSPATGGGFSSSGTGGSAASGQGGGSSAGQGGRSFAGQGGGSAPGQGGTPSFGNGGSREVGPPTIFDGTPSPPAAGARFPFPQNRLVSGCSYPAMARNADVRAAYDHWKSLTLTSNGAMGQIRVQRTMEAGFDTVSEGISYGMLVSVYMNDQATFDKLWLYEQKYSDPVGLMNWRVSADGGSVTGNGSATDADEDMAWALIMADKQWGGSGSLGTPYLTLAKTMLDTMWQYDVDHGRGEMLRPGDGWMDDRTNPSYFAPAYYRVFARVTGNQDWLKVVDSSYSIIDKLVSGASASAGLVSNWTNSGGVPGAGPDGDYGYDACRTPFRIALDACLFGEPRAKTYLAKLSQFFAGVGAANLKDGYHLDGSPTGSSLNLAFLGPAAVGAMSASAAQGFLNDGYARAIPLLPGETYYYNSSWGILSLLMLSGNFLDYTQYP
jgi:endo-1,4-beta-D-glucanase Y